MFSALHALPTAPSRQQSRRTQCAVRASAAAGDAGEQRRQAVGVLAALTLLVATPQALAIPQTSACATNSCDDFDYSGKDLRKEYYTKGSLKRANFSNSDLQGVTLFGADLAEANFENANVRAVCGALDNVVVVTASHHSPPPPPLFPPLPAPCLQLVDANLGQCNLTGANLKSACARRTQSALSGCLTPPPCPQTRT
jgi:hypothetical protein